MSSSHVFRYQPRDFIATSDGLVFAVMSGHSEKGRIPGFLRYIHREGQYHKLGTAEANRHLAEKKPEYLFTSSRLHASLHGIPQVDILHHYQPGTRLQQILAEKTTDPLVQTTQNLCRLLETEGVDLEAVGITGSLLIGAHRAGSDIDLVIYQRPVFFKARTAIARLIASGDIQELAEHDWRSAYDRRGCALDFEAYLQHERRKLNKGILGGIKFDISLTGEDLPARSDAVAKAGYWLLRARVIDARYAYDYPAVYELDHPDIPEVWSFIQTYAGQAETGEWVEIRGLLEIGADGLKRIVVGSSREAPGEYIKTIGSEHQGMVHTSFCKGYNSAPTLLQA